MTTAAQRAVARRHYRDSRRVTLAAVRSAIRAWRGLDPGAPQRSWVRDGIGEQLLRTAVAGKLAAAQQAAPYLDEYLAVVEGPPASPARLVPRSLVTEAADGRELDQLLRQPMISALVAADRGALIADAYRAGELALARIMANEVANTGRVADQIEMATRPAVAGYIRLLTPPSCGRCVILAGRFYRWNADFERHPNCDCTAIPTTEAPESEELVDPSAAVRAGQVRGLSRADERAILEGADPGQVINAHSGMYTTDGVKFTRAGTTRRGFAAARFRQVTGRRISQRLRPEAIFQIAGDDRDEALRLLHLHGYLL